MEHIPSWMLRLSDGSVQTVLHLGGACFAFLHSVQKFRQHPVNSSLFYLCLGLKSCVVVAVFALTDRIYMI